MTEPIPQAVVEMAERHSQAAAQFSLAGLEEARKRAHALLLILLAGGGTLGSVALAKIETQHVVGIAGLICAAYWFGIAASVAWRGATTTSVRSWATPELLDQYSSWNNWAKEERAEALARGALESSADAGLALRESAIRNCEKAAVEYREASGQTFKVVDRAYCAAAATPIVAGLAAAFVVYLAG